MSKARERRQINIERIDSLTDGLQQGSPAILFDHALYYVGTLVSSALILAFYAV